MLNYTSAKILLCVAPTDMRKSFNTLAVLVRQHLKGDPPSGTWFDFLGKHGDRLKILFGTAMATPSGRIHATPYRSPVTRFNRQRQGADLKAFNASPEAPDFY